MPYGTGMGARGIYLFTVMPPPELAARIEAVRRECADQFGTVRALKPPVHITLFVPFKATDEEAQRLSEMKSWAAQQPPTSLELHDFGFFSKGRTPVLFINVVQDPKLESLNANITTLVRERVEDAPEPEDRPYHPHITIAYRDTTRQMLPALKAAYGEREFRAMFPVPAFFLWKHDGNQWQVIDRFELTAGQITE
jgi:2'-5' RNA ligase